MKKKNSKIKLFKLVKKNKKNSLSRQQKFNFFTQAYIRVIFLLMKKEKGNLCQSSRNINETYFIRI